MQIGSIAIPLVEEWEAALTTHPDQVYVQLLLRGLRRGFRIGFDRANQLRSVHKNMETTQRRSRSTSWRKWLQDGC